MLENYDLDFDFDGDDVNDSSTVAVDLDGDGVADTFGLDVGGDGTVDGILSAVDTDGDGYYDSLVYDPLDTGDDSNYTDDPSDYTDDPSDQDDGGVEVDADGDGKIDGLGYDTDSDGELDTFYLDSDGDGVADKALYVNEVDTDGDGVDDSLVYAEDNDNNGTFEHVTIYTDADHDGSYESIMEAYDHDQDGIFDHGMSYLDTDGDHTYDTFIKEMDTDGDGQSDITYTQYDTNEDGYVDKVVQEQLIDTDGDGIADRVIVAIDNNADGQFDVVNSYDYDEYYDIVHYTPVDELPPQEYEYHSNPQFDPDHADSDKVIGDPGRSMEEWEYQGDTGRCAIYSQKFILEELTGEEYDIEELADIAEENGWFTESGGTNGDCMGKLLEYYGIDTNESYNNDFSDLTDALEHGDKVIVSIDADEIWYGDNDDIFTPGQGANHAVEVIGVDYSDPDNPMVILNDSGTPDGCGEMIPMDVFVDAWEDGSCQMITV